ncbi:hypothetical protein [Pseudomonas viridiflava]|uniref:hypothetical protein n=1 Tax=Pseudomonas viridiflava TaxID=33069 RepID=UPI000F0559FC|nr:hypothetical protein [Pseudomonas viridiflava]
MPLDVSHYVHSYYQRAEPCEKNEYPRLKAWEFIWEYIWSDNEKWGDLVSQSRLETTALHLGFYLANWGMFRGSSGLLLNSNLDFMKALAKLLFQGDGPKLFELSMSDFSPDSQHLVRNQKLLDTVVASMDSLWDGVSWTTTLKSKILLGVWGEYPALDRYYMAARRDLYPRRSHLSGVSGKGLTAIATLIGKEKLIFPSLETEKKKLEYPTGRLFDMAMYEYGSCL